MMSGRSAFESAPKTLPETSPRRSSPLSVVRIGSRFGGIPSGLPALLQPARDRLGLGAMKVHLGPVAGGKNRRFLDRLTADQVAQSRSQRFDWNAIRSRTLTGAVV